MAVERTGAQLRFYNGSEAETGPERSGAVVELRWPAARLIAPTGPLGENRPITA